jgi:DNA repair protein RadC
VTQSIIAFAEPLGITVHDHLIVAREPCQLQELASDLTLAA